MSEGLNEKIINPTDNVDSTGELAAPTLTPAMEELRRMWFNATLIYIPVTKKVCGVGSLPLSQAPADDAARFLRDRFAELAKK